MQTEEKTRLRWVKLYQETLDPELVCFKCGISRPTLEKWLRRYRKYGEIGLKSLSRRPTTSPKKKVTPQYEQWILELRKRRLGTRRLQNELKREYNCSLSRETIHKVLTKHNVKPLIATRRVRKSFKRYERVIPGDRIQIDTCKIAPGIYQYTAVDDCTRFRVLAIYKQRSVPNSLLFLEYLNEEFPFPIQRIQSDRGQEFFGYKFQEKLGEYAIKFGPNKPASPHLNGKVERSQKTDLAEFWSLVDLKDVNLSEKLREWQDYYNHFRVPGSLKGQTPWEKWWDLASKTPIYEEVEALYDYSKERIKLQNYRADLEVMRLAKEG